MNKPVYLALIYIRHVYIRPPCTFPATTVHIFRAYQGRIYTSLAVGKKLLSTQKVRSTNIRSKSNSNL